MDIMAQTTNPAEGGIESPVIGPKDVQPIFKDLKIRSTLKNIKPRVDSHWRQLPSAVLATQGRASPRAAQRLASFWRRMAPSLKTMHNLATMKSLSAENISEGPFRLERKPWTMFRAASIGSLLSASTTRPESVRVDPRERSVKELEGTDNAMTATMPTTTATNGDKDTDEPLEEESTISAMKTRIKKIVEYNLLSVPAKEQQNFLRISEYLIEHGLVDENLASYRPLDITGASVSLSLWLLENMELYKGPSLYSQVSERMCSITREIARLAKDAQQDEGQECL